MLHFHTVICSPQGWKIPSWLNQKFTGRSIAKTRTPPTFFKKKLTPACTMMHECTWKNLLLTHLYHKCRDHLSFNFRAYINQKFFWAAFYVKLCHWTFRMILELSSFSLKMSKPYKGVKNSFWTSKYSKLHFFPKFERPKSWIWLISDVQICLNSNFGQFQMVKIWILTKFERPKFEFWSKLN